MEAVDELESERDEQGDAQQDVRQISCGRSQADIFDVVEQSVGGKQQPEREHPDEEDDGQRIQLTVEMWARGWRRRGRPLRGRTGCAVHEVASRSYARIFRPQCVSFVAVA